MDKIDLNTVPQEHLPVIQAFIDDLNALIESDPEYYDGLFLWKVGINSHKITAHLSWYDLSTVELLNKYNFQPETSCACGGDCGCGNASNP